MRSRVWLTLVAFLATLPLSGAGQARVNTSCPAFGHPCECAWHVRDCLPRCHIQPRLECDRSSAVQHEEATP